MKLKLSTETMDTVRSQASKMARDEQISVNHENCPAGEDTRQRLYIKVTSDGKMALAHCFNCGGSGGVRLAGRPARIPSGSYDMVGDEARQNRCDTDRSLWTNAIPIIDSPEWDSWPEKYFADCWNELAGANGFDIRRHQAYSKWVLFPRGDASSPTGWEARSASKQITRNILPEYKDDTKLLIYNKDASRTAVVCEDPISAMKVSLAGYAGVALCGTNMTTDDAFKMSLLFDNILVWLDNDKPEIVAQAARLQTKLLMYTSSVKINKLYNDPKKYTLVHIQGTVRGAFTSE